MHDRLAGDWSRRWTGKVHALCGLIRVDGKAYRFLGNAPQVADEAMQVDLVVSATQTRYRFTAGPVQLLVTFTSPLLLDDLELLSRPASYVTCEVTSADDKSHAVQLYFDATAEWAVNKPSQRVTWERASVAGMQTMKIGTVDQAVLGTKGDDVRIDWGYLYLAAPHDSAQCVIAADVLARGEFAETKAPSTQDDADKPRTATIAGRCWR